MTKEKIIYQGADSACPPDGLLGLVEQADGFIICPSNPLVSIGPILSISDYKKAIKKTQKPVIGISPLIGNAPVKGPLGSLMKGLNIEVSSVSVAKIYQELIHTLIIDHKDEKLKPSIEKLNINVVITNTLMETMKIKRSLARLALNIIRGENA